MNKQTNDETKELIELNKFITKANEAKKFANEDARESIILKGISTSINAMNFPKFTNLNEMLNQFGYKMIPIAGESLTSIIKFNQVQINQIHAKLCDINRLSEVPTIEEKKLLLADNSYSYYINLDLSLDILDLSLTDEINQMLGRIVNQIVVNPKVHIANLPIFKINGNAYSVSLYIGTSVDELYNFINDAGEIGIYTIVISNERIYMRYALINK